MSAKSKLGSRFDLDNFSPNEAKDTTHQLLCFIPTIDGSTLDTFASWRKIMVFTCVPHEFLLCYLCLEVKSNML